MSIFAKLIHQVHYRANRLRSGSNRQRITTVIFLALILFPLVLHADIYDRLSELPGHLRSGGVPRDGIPAMTNPVAVAPDEAQYLSDTDQILGVVVQRTARAYPHNLGWKHEVINDRLGGRYITVTFCPLTATGLVFDATAPDTSQIEFGVSGLLINSNLVLYDRRDEETLYPQMIYAGISGEYQGQTLELLPVIETTWELWRKMYPGTTIAQAATGLEHYPSYIQDLYPLETYGHYPYADYRSNHQMIIFAPTTSRPSEKLATKAMVLGLRCAGESKAYPFDRMPDSAVINDHIADTAILVVYDQQTATAIPYSRVLDNRTLSFRALERRNDLPLSLVDQQTGSEWNMLGRALSGPLEGAQLKQLPAYNSMWFGWSAYWPETHLWNGEGLAPPP